MPIHTELFSNVSGLGLIHCGLGLEKIFGPRPHSFWPRPWPHAQLASLTSLEIVSPGNQHRPMDGVSMGDQKTCLTQRRRKWSRRLLSAAARRKSGQIYAMRPRNFRDRRVCCYPGDASDDSGGSSSSSSSSLSCQVFYSHTLVEELCRKLANYLRA